VTDLPESWPPKAREGGPGRIVPLFPLAKVFLYPGVIMPLHIFEPRYRRMVDDLLDRQGWLIISSIVDGHEQDAEGTPPVYGVAGLGEIVKHTSLPDGRYLITLAGLARVRIEEVESELPYRQVRFEPLREVPPPKAEAQALCERLRRAIFAESEVFLNLPPDLPPGQLADLLLQHLDLPVEEMQRVFAEYIVADRAELALARHAPE
jgi:ATP-dependent Lon protease